MHTQIYFISWSQETSNKTPIDCSGDRTPAAASREGNTAQLNLYQILSDTGSEASILICIIISFPRLICSCHLLGYLWCTENKKRVIFSGTFRLGRSEKNKDKYWQKDWLLSIKHKYFSVNSSLHLLCQEKGIVYTHMETHKCGHTCAQVRITLCDYNVSAQCWFQHKANAVFDWSLQDKTDKVLGWSCPSND